MENLETRINEIEKRNQRVESDKAWETSKTRLTFIAVITYLVALASLIIIGSPQPYLSAFVPVVGFLLSTLSLPPLKEYWKRKIKKDGI
ncbi:MAG TPA: hypothetical protein VEA59_01040 [Patescibacteria group bacterium]|nr:hypothetical protein [Patescibacteria group bacterium]